MRIKIQRLNDLAVLPKYAHASDAGMDLVATSKSYDEYGNVVYGFGIAVEIPEGYVGLVFPRSSNCKHALTLSNSVGVIDSGYRGEVMAKFSHNLFLLRHKYWWQRLRSHFNGLDVRDTFGVKSLRYREYEIGERVAQLIVLPYPKVEWEVVDKLSASDRGKGGYGSTGK